MGLNVSNYVQQGDREHVKACPAVSVAFCRNREVQWKLPQSADLNTISHCIIVSQLHKRKVLLFDPFISLTVKSDERQLDY